MLLDKFKINLQDVIIKIINIIFLSILIIIFVLNYNVYATSNKNVYLNSDKYSLKENEEFYVKLNIDDTNLGAFTAYINFDKDKVDFISGPENINVKEDEIIYVWFNKKNESDLNKDVLGKFKFRAKGKGLATITCFGDFYDNNANKLEINFKEVSFFINSDEIESNDESKKEDENISINKNKERNITNGEDLENNSFTSKSSTSLETLAVENVILYPNFDNTVYEYNGQVSVDTDDINILAVPENENANVDILRKEDLKEGNNKISVIVTSEDKKYKKEYIINIYKRNDAEEKKYIEYKNKNKERLEEAYDIAYTINDKSNDSLNNKFINILVDKNINISQIVALLFLLSISVISIFGIRKLVKSKK